jgi:uncharacterized repeat protein (TIGR03803 family)
MYFDGVAPQGGLTTDGTGFYGATSASLYAPGGLLYGLLIDTPAANPLATIYEYGRRDEWLGALPGSTPLLGSDGNLYGSTFLNSIDTTRGTSSGTGTIFRVARGGQNYSKLFEFAPYTLDSRLYAVNATGTMQLIPPYETQGQLIEGLESGVKYLYGTAFQGGPDGTGTIYKIRTDGTGFQVLAPFAAAALVAGTAQFDVNADGRLKNLHGVNPTRRLLLGGNGYLYGVTRDGGANGTGVIYRVPVAGGGIEVLNEFDAIVPGTSTTDPTTGVVTITLATNAQGGYPKGGLTLSGGLIYGTTSQLGANGVGTVFSIGLDGSGFTVLRAFNNTDGALPSGELIVTNDGMLAGTTRAGGTFTTTVTTGTSAGLVYKMSLDGLTLSQECVFNSANPVQGNAPQDGVLQMADGNFYGTAPGGLYAYGAIFKCGTPYTGQLVGLRPFVDQNGGGGALPLWMIFGLIGLASVQMARSTRRRNALVVSR